MKKYRKSILAALVCFLVVIILNFALPRLLPGNPIAYLTGMAEEDLTVAQEEYYRKALHLDENIFVQFYHYIVSLLDGSLGYSFKKEAVVSALIGERLGYTLQITLPAVFFSTALGLFWGLACGYRKDSLGDKLSTVALIGVNTLPAFLVGLLLMVFFCFENRWFPYTGLNSVGVMPGDPGFFVDRLWHLALPVLTLTLGTLPSRFLLMRNTAAKIAGEKYVLYARQRGLSHRKVQLSYMLRNIAQPFISMVGLSVGVCVGGSVVVENIFSVPGMGTLLTQAVNTLDYPLLQGILFVTTAMMVSAIVICDTLCVLIDPKVRRDAYEA